jgi:hypothetical protein
MSNPGPQVRRRPTKFRSMARPDSNLVRASVLETAMELGVGHNSTVANWIFNSPLTEESEELEDISLETEADEVCSHYVGDDVNLNISLHYYCVHPRRHRHLPSLLPPISRVMTLHPYPLPTTTWHPQVGRTRTSRAYSKLPTCTLTISLPRS